MSQQGAIKLDSTRVSNSWIFDHVTKSTSTVRTWQSNSASWIVVNDNDDPLQTSERPNIRCMRTVIGLERLGRYLEFDEGHLRLMNSTGRLEPTLDIAVEMQHAQVPNSDRTRRSLIYEVETV